MNYNGYQPPKVFGRNNPNYQPQPRRKSSTFAPLIDNRNVQDLKDSFNSYVEHDGNGFDVYDEEQEVISEIKDKDPTVLPDFNVVKDYTDNENIMLSFAHETISSAKRKYREEYKNDQKLNPDDQVDGVIIRPHDSVHGSDGGYVEFDSQRKEKDGEPVAIGYHYNSEDPSQPQFISAEGKITFNE